MDDVSGVVQTPATIEQIQQVSRQEQQGDATPAAGVATGAADTVTLSEEGLQLSQTVGRAEAVNDDTAVADGQEENPNDQTGGPPVFLDIRA